MVKIKYNGDISPCNVTVYDTMFRNWKRDEIRELDEYSAEKLLKDNKNFARVDSNVKESKQNVSAIKPSVNLDLNNDGKIDKKDFTLAAKVLSQSKKNQI